MDLFNARFTKPVIPGAAYVIQIERGYQIPKELPVMTEVVYAHDIYYNGCEKDFVFLMENTAMVKWVHVSFVVTSESNGGFERWHKRMLDAYPNAKITFEWKWSQNSYQASREIAMPDIVWWRNEVHNSIMFSYADYADTGMGERRRKFMEANGIVEMYWPNVPYEIRT
jgi:hypothetical protein